MHDLAVIVVSTNEAQWIEPCLETVFAAAEGISLDVVVADNESTDGTRELVERRFPAARVVTCRNMGFSHANNCALKTSDARYVLFLNPDTEVVSGTFGELIATMDARPEIGLVGVRQLDSDGALHPTMRRFPNAVRALGDAICAERLPYRGLWSGEREMRMALYERDVACDWTSGSFMLARREAIATAGYLDERFFIYSEEVDFCLRIRRGGWDVRHFPTMTIVHHASKGGVNPKMVAQDAYSRLQYARKHFSPGHRVAYRGALCLRHLLRATLPGRDRQHARLRRAAARRALAVLLARADAPFGAPPTVGVEIDSAALPEGRADVALA